MPCDEADELVARADARGFILHADMSDGYDGLFDGVRVIARGARRGVGIVLAIIIIV